MGIAPAGGETVAHGQKACVVVERPGLIGLGRRRDYKYNDGGES
jgi:hypothetical protein